MIYTEKSLKDIKEITDELLELIPDNFNYKNVDRQTLCVWLKSRLETCIQQAGQEILNNVVLEIEKLRYEDDLVGWDSSEEWYNKAIDDVIKLINN